MSTSTLAGPVRQAIVRAERRPLPEYLTRDQVHRLLAAGRTVRDRLLVQVCWETGGRISEVLALTRQDLDLPNRQLRLRTLKRPKRRDLTGPGARSIHPHTLRHSFVVKELMGHASILTTMVYLCVVPVDLCTFLARVEF